PPVAWVVVTAQARSGRPGPEEVDSCDALLNNPTPMARVLVLLSAVLFGTTGTAQALGPDAAPVTVGAARIAIGGALLLLVARAVPAAAAPGRGGSWRWSPARSPSTSSRSSPPSTAPAWPSGRSSRSAPRLRSPVSWGA